MVRGVGAPYTRVIWRPWQQPSTSHMSPSRAITLEPGNQGIWPNLVVHAGLALLALLGQVEVALFHVVHKEQGCGGGGPVKQQAEVAVLPLRHDPRGLAVDAHQRAVHPQAGAALPDLQALALFARLRGSLSGVWRIACPASEGLFALCTRLVRDCLLGCEWGGAHRGASYEQMLGAGMNMCGP